MVTEEACEGRRKRFSLRTALVPIWHLESVMVAHLLWTLRASTRLLSLALLGLVVEQDDLERQHTMV